MRIRVLSSTLLDLKEGKYFYDLQQPGIGEYFYDSLFADIDSLQLYAGIHRQVFGYYRLLAKRFPYAIYYKITNETEVVVYRALDCRQEPLKITDALKKS